MQHINIELMLFCLFMYAGNIELQFSTDNEQVYA